MKQETINSKALCHVLLVPKQTIFWLLELFQVQGTRQCSQPMITFSERSR